MTDIFNEIEEDIRRERMARIWKRFGPVIVAVALFIVLGVAGWRGWEWYSANQAQEAGGTFEAAMALSESGDRAKAEETLAELAKSGPSGYALLARFRAATELAATNRAGAAVEQFEAISQDISAPALVRDLARIRSALILVDTGSQSDVASRVEALAVAGNAWRHTARELLALAAWKGNNAADTRRWAQELVSDIEAPPGARARGQVLLDLADSAAPSAP